MCEAGKIHNTIKEMERLHIDIMGISEMRWPGTGECQVDDHIVYYAGNVEKNHLQGVGFILNKKLRSTIIGCLPHSDRVIMIKLRGSPFNVNLIQVYAPTSDKSEEVIEDFYAQIKEVLKNTKRRDINIIMGDFNAKVGKGSEDDIVGNFGLGQRSERGNRLVQFCREERLVVTNTLFKQPPRRLYTWKAPGDKPGNIIRNQIDFVLINQRFRSSIISTKTYPGADVPSDHIPLVSVIKMKLRKTRVQGRKRNRYDYSKLQDTQVQEKVKEVINREIYSVSMGSAHVEDMWGMVKGAMTGACNQYLKSEERQRGKKHWMTDEILKLMEKRRTVKAKDPEAYWQIHKDIKRKIREAKERWLSEKCREIEKLNQKHDTFNVHKKVKEATGRNRKRITGNITNRQGQVIMEIQEKMKIWKEYIQDLLKTTNAPQYPHKQTGWKGRRSQYAR